MADETHDEVVADAIDAEGIDAEAAKGGAAPAPTASAEGEGKPDVDGAKESDDAPDTVEESRKVNRAFAVLSRKEKAFAQREKTHADDLAELKIYRQLRAAAAKGDTTEWLKAGGITGPSNEPPQPKGPQPPKDDPADARIQELQKQLDEREKRYQGALQQLMQQQYIDRIQRVMDSDPEAYELLRAENRQADVFALMDAYYRESGGQKISEKEACDLLESTLLEQTEATAKRYRGYKKLAPRLGWETPAVPQPDGKKAVPPKAAKQAGQKTLTHASAPSSGAPKVAPKKVHPEQEFEQLVERFRSGG